MNRDRKVRLLLLWLLVALLGIGSFAPRAGAATGDPLFVVRPEPPPMDPTPIPPPRGQLEGPCGLAVDGNSRFYVSDYHHHAIDVYSQGGSYSTQLANEDPLDGPCGLALGPGGNLYVNNFHRNVVRFGTVAGFGTGVVIAGVGADSFHPTGVAVDGRGTIYVDERDRIATFSSAGIEGEPIGGGSLGDAYGVAVSGFAGTAGFVYVPDAATETIKVYDPASSRTVPVAQITGAATPSGRFVSLRDAAVAVDNATGTVYVVDDLTPEYTEGHEAVVYAFGSAGAYLGRLKFSIETALPAGLAVDNSGSPSSQGRVYVTSGYTEVAAVYAYPPGSAASTAVPLPAAASALALPAGSGSPQTLRAQSVQPSPIAATPSALVPAGGAPRGVHRARTRAQKRRNHKRHHPGRRQRR